MLKIFVSAPELQLRKTLKAMHYTLEYIRSTPEYRSLISALEAEKWGIAPCQEELLCSILDQEFTDPRAPIFVTDRHGYDSSELIIRYMTMRNTRDMLLAVDGVREKQFNYHDIFFMCRDYYKSITADYNIGGILRLTLSPKSA